MYETLAISAFHMSTTYPEKASLYLRESAALQAQALAIFTSTNHTIDRENIIPSFLFSSVLGLHFFCETFTSPRSDLNGFLDRLVQSIKLLRGVTAVIGDHWKDILNSDIRVLLAVEEAETIDRNDSITHAFSSLHRRLSLSSIITSIELEICSEALTKLLSVYNSQPLVEDGMAPDVRTIITWPITLTAEFTQLLEIKKPEALVILAYFSILLNDRKNFWVVGEAGRDLLGAIAEYLGEDWAEWLEAPKLLVFGEAQGAVI
jgi:hypothetical protein